jgi:hypothetical protein
MINIISTFYIQNERNDELMNALLNNLSSPFVEKIHLFVDDMVALETVKNISNSSDKINIIDVGKKPTYHDFFRFIIDNLKDKICMISNSDIYIHECDISLIKLLNKNKIVYALTRYEHDMSSPLINEYFGSHDCYIFNSSFINEDTINKNTNFFQDINGIETRILYSFHSIGFLLINPCYQIKIVHLHKSGYRPYNRNQLWIGLHEYGSDDFFKSCWCVRPTRILQVD